MSGSALRHPRCGGVSSAVKVSEFLLHQVKKWGVRHIYGVIGDAILPLMDALSRDQDIRFIPVRHESAAGFMASTEGKLTGRLAVCIGTSGPGLANLLNGMADAYADRVPLLAITGQVESDKVGTGSKQYVNQQAIVQGISGYAETVAGPRAVPQMLLRALKTAVGEGRVAQISVPKDCFAAEIGGMVRPAEPFLTAPPITDPETIQMAARMLQEAHCPLILAGHGARTAGRELLELAERVGAGIVVALGGKGTVPDANPLVLGGVGTGGSDAAHRALQQTDLLFVAGSTWWPTKYMPKDARVIQMDRWPVNIALDTAVACGLPGDARQVIPALLTAIRSRPQPDRTAWRQQLGAWKRAWADRLATESMTVSSTEGPVHPAVLVRALQKVAAPETVFTLDTGDHLLWFNRHFQADGQRVLFSGTWRSMGYALPAANAVKLCNPEASAIALVGDGGLTMLLGELATSMQQGLKVTVVVSSNGTLGLEENKARSEGLKPFGHVLNNPDFQAVARAFGWQAWRVTAPADLEWALAEAVSAEGPALVDVQTVNDPSLYVTSP